MAWATMRPAPLPEPVLPARSRIPAITGAAGVGADRGDQRRKSLAQHLLAGDLGVPVGGALFGVSVDRAQQRVDVDERALHRRRAADRRAAHSATRCSRSTDSSWRACPKVNSRNNVPIVEGAYTPPNRVFIPPVRSTSTSSMLSAPGAHPGDQRGQLRRRVGRPGLDPRRRRYAPSRANSSDSPVCSASVITGTSPAHDTRLSSSNTAESAVNLCETCTGSAFLNWADCCVRTPIIPAQRAAAPLTSHGENTPTQRLRQVGRHVSGSADSTHAPFGLTSPSNMKGAGHTPTRP